MFMVRILRVISTLQKTGQLMRHLDNAGTPAKKDKVYDNIKVQFPHFNLIPIRCQLAQSGLLFSIQISGQYAYI